MEGDERVRAIRSALRDDPADARRRASRLVASATRAGDAKTAALARFLRGDALQVLGDMGSAERDYRDARRWFDANGHLQLARLVDLSELQVQVLLGRADRFRATARRLRVHFKDPPARVVVEQAAGNGWRALGREERAEACFRDALGRLGRRRDRRSRMLRALVRQDLGVCLAHRGAAADAVRVLSRAHDELIALDLAHSASVAQANLAWSRGVAGDLARACSGLPEVARSLERQGDHRRALIARLDAADLRRRLGDFDRAARDGAAVATALSRAALPAEEARARLVVARSRMALGREAKARAEARRAAVLSERSGDRAGACEARLVAGDEAPNAARTLMRAGRWLAAVDAILEEARAKPAKRAAQLLVRAESQLPPALRPWLRPDRCRRMAEAEPARRIVWLRRAVRASEQLRDRAPTAALRATSLARHLELYEELASALLERGRAADRREAFGVLDAARARTLREELDRAAPGIGQTRRIRGLRARLEQLWNTLDRSDGDSTNLRGRTTPLLREIRRHERELAEALADRPGSTAARAGDWGDSLAFARVGRRCVGLLARGGDVEIWEAGSMDALRRELDAFRFQIRRRLHGATDTRAVEGVLDRFGRALLPDGFTAPARLRVVLPAELGDLPLEAVSFAGAPLAEACCIEYAPCAAWRARPWRARGAHTVVGLSAQGLPEIDREVELVAHVVAAGHRLQGDAATRTAVLDALRGSRLIHLAGHAEARDDAPPLSALRVRDGWLAAADLADVPLAGALVVLSACRTGDPALQWQGEAMGGFPRALLAAGAAGIVASRWPVEDRLARAWMEEMYRVLPDLGPAEAVRAAGRAIRMRQRHPADWASFLFVPGGSGL
jgi:tetratricopeptide (TPR) repeat protein